MHQAIELDTNNFESQVIQASEKILVLVDFWADWCTPCLAIAPVLNQVMHEYQNDVLYTKLEVDAGENMKLAGRYQVRGFPTIMLFRYGEERERFSGMQSAEFIRDFILDNL